jgi:hypothetical protein
MSIRCAHCRGRHETVAEVRECAGVNPNPDPEYTNLSKGQQTYLSDLLVQLHCELADGATPETVSYKVGQPIITALVAARRNKSTRRTFTLPAGVVQLARPHDGERRVRTTRNPNLPEVPPGYYAIPSVTGTNDLGFYRVKVKTRGIWEGRTFVDEVIGGHPEDKVLGPMVKKVLEAIVAFGIEDAGILYGHTIKQCYNCNRRLTKKASRILKLGRHCAGIKGKLEEWDALNVKFDDADADDDDE